jgi:hypothetical protein
MSWYSWIVPVNWDFTVLGEKRFGWHVVFPNFEVFVKLGLCPDKLALTCFECWMKLFDHVPRSFTFVIFILLRLNQSFAVADT